MARTHYVSDDVAPWGGTTGVDADLYAALA
jgi:hypothetical protein